MSSENMFGNLTSEQKVTIKTHTHTQNKCSKTKKYKSVSRDIHVEYGKQPFQ